MLSWCPHDFHYILVHRGRPVLDTWRKLWSNMQLHPKKLPPVTTSIKRSIAGHGMAPRVLIDGAGSTFQFGVSETLQFVRIFGSHVRRKSLSWLEFNCTIDRYISTCILWLWRDVRIYSLLYGSTSLTWISYSSSNYVSTIATGSLHSYDTRSKLHVCSYSW